MSRITLATIKSFIRKNTGKLHILTKSRFDGMVDGCESTGQIDFIEACKTTEHVEHTLGIQGAWFVGSSRDYFTPFNQGGFNGFAVSNSCGRFILAVKVSHAKP